MDTTTTTEPAGKRARNDRFSYLSADVTSSIDIDGAELDALRKFR